MNVSTLTTVLKSGRSLNSANLSLKYMKLAGSVTNDNQYSFVVSKKTNRLAVGRNLLKRRGRHIIRKHSDEIKVGYACVFFFKMGATRMKFPELEEEFLGLLSKAKLI